MIVTNKMGFLLFAQACLRPLCVNGDHNIPLAVTAGVYKYTKSRKNTSLNNQKVNATLIGFLKLLLDQSKNFFEEFFLENAENPTVVTWAASPAFLGWMTSIVS